MFPLLKMKKKTTAKTTITIPIRPSSTPLKVMMSRSNQSTKAASKNTMSRIQTPNTLSQQNAAIETGTAHNRLGNASESPSLNPFLYNPDPLSSLIHLSDSIFPDKDAKYRENSLSVVSRVSDPWIRKARRETTGTMTLVINIKRMSVDVNLLLFKGAPYVYINIFSIGPSTSSVTLYRQIVYLASIIPWCMQCTQWHSSERPSSAMVQMINYAEITFQRSRSGIQALQSRDIKALTYNYLINNNEAIAASPPPKRNPPHLLPTVAQYQTPLREQVSSKDRVFTLTSKHHWAPNGLKIWLRVRCINRVLKSVKAAKLIEIRFLGQTPQSSTEVLRQLPEQQQSCWFSRPFHGRRTMRRNLSRPSHLRSGISMLNIKKNQLCKFLFNTRKKHIFGESPSAIDGRGLLLRVPSYVRGRWEIPRWHQRYWRLRAKPQGELHPIRHIRDGHRRLWKVPRGTPRARGKEDQGGILEP